LAFTIASAVFTGGVIGHPLAKGLVGQGGDKKLDLRRSRTCFVAAIVVGSATLRIGAESLLSLIAAADRRIYELGEIHER